MFGRNLGFCGSVTEPLSNRIFFDSTVRCLAVGLPKSGEVIR